jgi:hypothetical protein
MSDLHLGMHLKSLEETLLDPTTRRDRAIVAALLTEDFREFGSSGREWSREEILDHLATEDYTPPAIEDYTPPAIEDFRCQPITQDVALVTYKTVRTDPATAETRSALRSSLWVRDGGLWRIRFHQGTPALQNSVPK